MKYVSHEFPGHNTLFTIFVDKKPVFLTEDDELIYILETKQIIERSNNET